MSKKGSILEMLTSADPSLVPLTAQQVNYSSPRYKPIQNITILSSTILASPGFVESRI